MQVYIYIFVESCLTAMYLGALARVLLSTHCFLIHSFFIYHVRFHDIFCVIFSLRTFFHDTFFRHLNTQPPHKANFPYCNTISWHISSHTFFRDTVFRHLNTQPPHKTNIPYCDTILWHISAHTFFRDTFFRHLNTKIEKRRGINCPNIPEQKNPTASQS